jgi:NAD(P)-dependent dehydrogenase (short-subunit alcohol dehydrogenase family)
MTEPLALVTGAGRGIGKAIAERLAVARIPVVLVARSAEEITELRNAIVAGGGRAYACPCDISSSAEVEALKNDIEADLGVINILVNNAGIAPTAKLENTTDEMWRETFAVNAEGAFYMCRAFVPAMKLNGGHVVAIGSTASYQGFKYNAAYAASKHALLGLMRALAAEYKGTDVKFSTLCPGFTRTSILEEGIRGVMARGGKTREEAEKVFGAMNREQRLIEPEEIAETIMRLLGARNLPTGLAYYSDGTVIDDHTY